MEISESKDDLLNSVQKGLDTAYGIHKSWIAIKNKLLEQTGFKTSEKYLSRVCQKKYVPTLEWLMEVSKLTDSYYRFTNIENEKESNNE